ncbi:MAG: hypothetical protein H6Q89_627 [Myxococcaceae bacterium]|nr:hypothetical protein [Myxococcaceae bacterium]
MRALVLLAALLLGAAPAKAPRPGKARPAAVKAPDAGSEAPADAPVAAPVELKPAPKGHLAPGETACSACHVTAAWTEVKFNHDRTGFPLTGVHRSTSCKGCHTDSFDRPVPLSCNGCHRDVHAGDLGARCEGCHDTASWASKFDADAHRRTAFPLVGAHANLPCLECHAEASARRFSRPAVECSACHQQDLERTRTAEVNHFALGFTGSCRNCHNAFRFKPGIFPGHDACYTISSGSHAATPCAGCHESLSAPTTPGSCTTRTAKCTRCHLRPETDLIHSVPQVAIPVPGYAFQDLKCYACHKEVGTR